MDNTSDKFVQLRAYVYDHPVETIIEEEDLIADGEKTIIVGDEELITSEKRGVVVIDIL